MTPDNFLFLTALWDPEERHLDDFVEAGLVTADLARLFYQFSHDISEKECTEYAQLALAAGPFKVPEWERRLRLIDPSSDTDLEQVIEGSHESREFDGGVPADEAIDMLYWKTNNPRDHYARVFLLFCDPLSTPADILDIYETKSNP